MTSVSQCRKTEAKLLLTDVSNCQCSRFTERPEQRRMDCSLHSNTKSHWDFRNSWVFKVTWPLEVKPCAWTGFLDADKQWRMSGFGILGSHLYFLQMMWSYRPHPTLTSSFLDQWWKMSRAVWEDLSVGCWRTCDREHKLNWGERNLKKRSLWHFGFLKSRLITWPDAFKILRAVDDGHWSSGRGADQRKCLSMFVTRGRTTTIWALIKSCCQRPTWLNHMPRTHLSWYHQSERIHTQVNVTCDLFFRTSNVFERCQILFWKLTACLGNHRKWTPTQESVGVFTG